MELKKGTTLQSGNYTIECTLGNGGFGITYRAFQSRLQRKVAIKEFFIKDLCSRDGNAMVISNESSRTTVISCKNKFLKEARIVAGLNNAHIVRIHDVFEENGTAYYVMELLEGGSLKGLVERTGSLAEKEALEYIGQVAEALYHVHQKGILHLDIKPANIMLNHYRQAVLIDFGVSKHFNKNTDDTTTTTLGVTDGYSPLEQYSSNDISNLTPATDIYSLGASLLFLLTGTKPPKAVQINEHGLPSLPTGVSLKTRLALKKAMNPVKLERFQDVLSFTQVLGIVIHTPQITQDDTTTIVGQMEEGRKKDGKYFNYIVLGAAAGLLLFSGLFFAYRMISKEVGPKEEITTNVMGSRDSGGVVEQEKEEKPSPETPAAAKENNSPAQIRNSGTIDLGYATYSGKLKDGLPDGIGSITFRQPHVIDSRDPQQRSAEAGDVIKNGLFKEGHLVQGNLYSASGEKKGFIMIGG